MNKEEQWTQEIVDALWAEGRGQGELENYKPWIRRNEISSTTSFRQGQPCVKIGGRHKTTLSHLEQRFFLPSDISEAVEDIWEQFPMNPELTRICAEQAGIRHPQYNKTTIDCVLSTDFVLKMRKGVLVAVQVKPSKELAKPGVVARLEIERRYWKMHDVAWYIVTEAEVPETVLKNVRGIHNQALVAASRQEAFANEFVSVSRQVFQALRQHEGLRLSKATDAIDYQYGYDKGTALMHVMELIFRGRLVPDWRATLANQAVHTLFDRAVHLKVAGGR